MSHSHTAILLMNHACITAPEHHWDFSALPQGETGWEESSMSFSICTRKFLYHLYRRSQMSQIAANGTTVARTFN